MMQRLKLSILIIGCCVFSTAVFGQDTEGVDLEKGGTVVSQVPDGEAEEQVEENSAQKEFWDNFGVALVIPFGKRGVSVTKEKYDTDNDKIINIVKEASVPKFMAEVHYYVNDKQNMIEHGPFVVAAINSGGEIPISALGFGYLGGAFSRSSDKVKTCNIGVGAIYDYQTQYLKKEYHEGDIVPRNKELMEKGILQGFFMVSFNLGF